MQVTECNMLADDMGQVYDGTIVYQGVKLEMWHSQINELYCRKITEKSA